MRAGVARGRSGVWGGGGVWWRGGGGRGLGLTCFSQVSHRFLRGVSQVSHRFLIGVSQVSHRSLHTSFTSF